MTSLDFRKMMKEAKAKANKHVAEPETTDDAMKLSEPLVSSEAPQDWVVERFDYNMQEEIERFHEIYAKWQVGNIDHVYYMPNFVSEEEEATLLSNINAQPQERWTQLAHRRLQNWGGHPSVQGMAEEPLPDFLSFLCDRLSDQHFLPKRANHALINEYDGNEGISAHKDGPLYFPRVIILSIGGTTSITFKDRLRDPTTHSSLLLQRRSLFVFTKDAYEKYFHEIPVQHCDNVDEHFINCSPQDMGQAFLRTKRVSITLRVVPITKRAPEAPS